MSKERLENAEKILNHIKGYGIYDGTDDIEVFEWLIEQTKQKQELQKHYNQLREIAKNLSKKYNTLWLEYREYCEEMEMEPHERIRKLKEEKEAMQNGINEVEAIMEHLSYDIHILVEENKRYRETFNQIKKTSNDFREGHFLDIQDSFFVDEIIAILEKLEVEE